MKNEKKSVTVSLSVSIFIEVRTFDQIFEQKYYNELTSENKSWTHEQRKTRHWNVKNVQFKMKNLISRKIVLDKWWDM